MTALLRLASAYYNKFVRLVQGNVSSSDRCKYCVVLYCTVLYCSARWRDTAAKIISRYRTDSSEDEQVTPQEFIRKEG